MGTGLQSHLFFYTHLLNKAWNRGVSSLMPFPVRLRPPPPFCLASPPPLTLIAGAVGVLQQAGEGRQALKSSGAAWALPGFLSHHAPHYRIFSLTAGWCGTHVCGPLPQPDPWKYPPFWELRCHPSIGTQWGTPQTSGLGVSASPGSPAPLLTQKYPLLLLPAVLP